jgi:CysZ protein
MAGVIIAFILTIPLLNLVTPIVATAFMLHIFQRLRSRQQAGA